MVNEPKSLTISKLLSKGKYLIPLYQRNYAWGREEIFQLLKDIHTHETKGKYYLGTLVVAHKKIHSNAYFEIIDGQQRHTTLSIINAVFKQKTACSQSVEIRNLYFDAREKSQEILEQLTSDESSYLETKSLKTTEKGIINILNAVQVVEDFISEILNNKKEAIAQFTKTFYNNVLLFRVEVPQNTDLNHYFEIMNNRGEQLEKHEILKAVFMDKISEPQLKDTFALIWDACSDMNAHVQMNFKKEHRSFLFGADYQQLASKEKMYTLLSSKKNNTDSIIDNSNSEEKEVFTIEAILKDHELGTYSQNPTEKNKELFKSIIDFPNFLLQVLSVQYGKVPLDDKQLLKSFGYPDQLVCEGMDFIQQLLRYRVLFDRYVIKREEDDREWNWSLKRIKIETNNTYPVTTFERDELEKCRMLQAMFHVTFSANTYKDWLFELLSTFKTETSIEIKATTIINSLSTYAVARYRKLEEDYKDFLFCLGLKTPRFLFNYLDYLLWLEYYTKVRGDKTLKEEDKGTYLERIFEDRDKFKRFKFVQRNSIEHLFPQSRIHELDGANEEEKKNTMDSFGNLCLISRSSNSSLSNNTPFQKRHDSKMRNESLKLSVMFGSFDKKKMWDKTQIETHLEGMKTLLTRDIKLTNV